MSDAVKHQRKGEALYITIDRQERRNALNEAVASGIMAALDMAEASPDIRVIVLTGAGDKAFCAGGDLQPNAEGAPFTMNAADPRNYVAILFRRMETCRLPIIARVNGAALAGGFGLMCGCDMAVATDDTKFGVPEVNVGLFPLMIMPFLLRIVPYRRLMEMCLTGKPISANEALALNIVNYVVPSAELDTKVDELVTMIAANGPTGIKLGKFALHAIRDMGFDAALDYMQLMLPVMAQTEDAKEGFKAFIEKRKPNWKGR